MIHTSPDFWQGKTGRLVISIKDAVGDFMTIELQVNPKEHEKPQQDMASA
jgi:hypothetical protein